MDKTSSFGLKGKSVLITGGAGFLGTHFVYALSAAGANVAIADIAIDPAQQLAKATMKQWGNEAVGIDMNVADPSSVRQGFAQAIERLGKVDVLINNAAIDPKFDPSADQNEKLFESYPVRLLKRSLDVNVLGYVLASQQAVKHMKQAGAGVIINISSIYGLVGPDQSIYPEGTQKPVDYAVTKGAVNALTKWLATTYGQDGIRANTYTLGGVLKGHDKEFQKKYGARAPLGRMVELEEVGAPIVFLASDASSGMTGANLIVDGGWTAW
jgi:NAD(P)-dependent dehydrogenase (short-subunit alcohol dehydrogenase family)